MVQLNQGDVQRCVRVASMVIGVVCYALSSSFNHLYGEWNSFKICVYIVSSFIIFLAILFPKAGQGWWIFEYRAHFAFLVLTSTTVYSFYLDRKLRTKPDAYGIIASAAFATMSLCMSKSIDCGFLDLMLFFCGVLITQLMEIKPLLGLVGIGFSYFLIIFRSHYFRNYEVIDIASPQSISNGASSLDIGPLPPEHSIELTNFTALEILQPERPLGLLQMLSPLLSRLAELLLGSRPPQLPLQRLPQPRQQQTPLAQQQWPLHRRLVQEEQRPLLQLPLGQGPLHCTQLPLALLQLPLLLRQELLRLLQEQRRQPERLRLLELLLLWEPQELWEPWQELWELWQEQRQLWQEQRQREQEQRRVQEQRLRQQQQQQWHQQLRQRRTQLRQRRTQLRQL